MAANLEVKPSSFGFAVAVHPKDPDTAWFVPEIKDEKRIPADGQFVVTRTRDGGKTFDILRKGLPTNPPTTSSTGTASTCRRAATNSSWAPPRGALGLRRSGRHLDLRAARLPPVYAVRWLET